MNATQQRLQQEQGDEAATVHLHVGCHSKMWQMLADSADADENPHAAEFGFEAPRLICFNLGEGISSGTRDPRSFKVSMAFPCFMHRAPDVNADISALCHAWLAHGEPSFLCPN